MDMAVADVNDITLTRSEVSSVLNSYQH